MVSLHHRVDEPTLIAMRDTLAHRGPDDAGLWSSADGTAALATRRLAIIDLSSAGHQPMLSHDGAHCITYNGEIYNYLELRDELQQRGHQFRSDSDTEVILASYQEWGTDCVIHFNGMFAFAIWDEVKQLLFAARDRFGEKPFYYTLLDGERTLLFASEIKAILRSGLLPIEANGFVVYRYLQQLDHDGIEDTFFSEVRSLPGGRAFVFEPHERRLRMWQYWSLSPDRETRLPDDQAYAEQFLDLLRDSVRLRLRSDVPVGSSLSGGLDSSTIVCLVAQLSLAPRQATFSARFDDPRFDEGPHIRTVVDALRGRVDPHEVFPDPARLPGELEALTWYQGQPFSSTTMFAQWQVMRLAKEHDVTVLLDGQGGDEMLAGYHFFFAGYFLGLLKRWQWSELARVLPIYLRDHGTRYVPMLLSKWLPPATQERLRRCVLAPGVDPAFEKSRIGPPDLMPPVFHDPLKDMLYWSLTRNSLPALLRYGDRDSMAASREVRLPYLDHRLVEYVFSIPSAQIMRGATTKHILRAAAKGLIPDAIGGRRDKQGYAPPEAAWLAGPLRAWATEVLQSPEFAARPWTDASRIQRFWEQFLAGRRGLHGKIWRWLSLEYWARVYLDRPPLDVAPALSARDAART